MKRWIVLGAALLSGCSGMPGFRDNGQAVEVTEIARTLHCGTEGEAARLSVLADRVAVQDWQQQRGVELSGNPLPQGPFALVEMGQRPSGGYGIAISRVATVHRDVLILHATFVSPAADAITSQALTAPCVLVSLPAQGYADVQVVDQQGSLRARSADTP